MLPVLRAWKFVFLLTTIFSLSFLFFTVPRHALAATGINKQINFQGKVVNADGTNVTNGTYNFVFNLYTGASGGSTLWTESKTLTVTDGIFQTALGDTTALPGSINFNTDNIYLGITFNNDGEMTPRVQFTAVPYAFNAAKVGGLTVTDTTGTFTLTSGKTLAVNNTLTFAGTDASVITFQGSDTYVGRATTDTLTNKTIGTTGLTFTGAATDITTGANEDLVILADGTGVIKFADFTTANGVLYVSATDGTISQTAAATGAQCLKTAGAGLTPAWGSCATAWNAIADPTGTGAINMNNTAQTLDWTTPATATAVDGLTITITNASTTDTTTQRALVVANKNDSAATGTVETIVDINNQDIDETVTNGLLIEQTGAGTMANAIQILNTAGTMTTGLTIGNNITTGISMGTGLTTAISIQSGTLALNSGLLTSTGNITIDATSTVIIPAADTLQTDDVTAPAASALTLTTSTSGAIVLQPLGPATTGDVQVGAGGAGSGTPDLLKLDVKSSAGDPTGANGAAYYNANTNRFRCFENGAWKDCTGPNIVKTTTDVINTTTAGADITGLGTTVSANTTYSFQCRIIANAAVTTTGIQMSMNGPASPTQFTATIMGFTSATAIAWTNISAYETYQANLSSAGATRTTFEIRGVLSNGATAGILIPRFKSEVATSGVTVYTGSWCEYF